MKISITQKGLIKCLNTIQSAVMTKIGSLPILSNFLIHAKKDHLIFIATDLEIAIKHTLKKDFTVVDEGSTTIPFKKFYDIISSLDENSDITIYLEDDKLYVISGKMKVKIITLPVSDYPAIPNINEKESFKVNAFSIVDMIEKTIFSVSDDKNSVLNGLLWKKSKNSFTVAATDGRRLGVVWREARRSLKLLSHQEYLRRYRHLLTLIVIRMIVFLLICHKIRLDLE
jgi:DNA polymerase-3 subunit beta